MKTEPPKFCKRCKDLTKDSRMKWVLVGGQHATGCKPGPKKWELRSLDESGWMRQSAQLAGQLAQKVRQINKLEQALRVIHIWAKCDSDSNESRKKAMNDIQKISGEALDQ